MSVLYVASGARAPNGASSVTEGNAQLTEGNAQPSFSTCRSNRSMSAGCVITETTRISAPQSRQVRGSTSKTIRRSRALELPQRLDRADGQRPRACDDPADRRQEPAAHRRDREREDRQRHLDLRHVREVAEREEERPAGSDRATAAESVLREEERRDSLVPLLVFMSSMTATAASVIESPPSICHHPGVSEVETRWSLIEKAAEGSRADREEFARLYGPLIRASLHGALRQRVGSELDDAIQETFVECFKESGALTRVDRGRPGGFRAFLYGVVRNVALRGACAPEGRAFPSVRRSPAGRRGW